uniref:Uncharacterized protein n=1 Tax=viral metagenome TaxID=1070528 RepID=A0A6C0DDS5_9ZZZZ
MSDSLQLFDSSIQVIPIEEILLSSGEAVPSAIGDHTITISKNNEFYEHLVKQVTENSFHAQKISPISDRNVNMVNEIYKMLSVTQIPTSESLTELIRYTLQGPTTPASSSSNANLIDELSIKYPNRIQKIKKAIDEIEKVKPLLSEMGKKGVNATKDVQLYIKTRNELSKQLELIKSGKLDRTVLKNVLENAEHSIRLIKDSYAIEENSHLNRKPTNIEEYINLTVPNLLTPDQELDVQSYNKVSVLVSCAVAYYITKHISNDKVKEHSVLKSKLLNERKELRSRLETDKRKKDRNARLTANERSSINERLNQITIELSVSEYENKIAKDCLKQIEIDIKDIETNLPADDEIQRYIKVALNSNKKVDTPSPSIKNRALSTVYSGLSGLRGYFSPPPRKNKVESFAMPSSAGQSGGQLGTSIVPALTSFAASARNAALYLYNPNAPFQAKPYSDDELATLAYGNPEAIAKFQAVVKNLSKIPKIQLAFGYDIASRPADIVSLFLSNPQRFVDAYGDKIDPSRLTQLATSAFGMIASYEEIKPYIDKNTEAYLQTLRSAIVDLTGYITLNNPITGQVIQDISITNILSLCDIGSVEIKALNKKNKLNERNINAATTPIAPREQLKYINAIADFDEHTVDSNSIKFTIHKRKIEDAGWVSEAAEVYRTEYVVIRFKKPNDTTIYSIKLGSNASFDEKLVPLMIRMMYNPSEIPSVRSFIYAIGGSKKFPLTPTYSGFYGRSGEIVRLDFPDAVKFEQKQAMRVLGQYAGMVVQTMERSYKQGMHDLLEGYKQTSSNRYIAKMADDLQRLMSKVEMQQSLLTGDFKNSVKKIGEDAINAADDLRTQEQRDKDKDWLSRAKNGFISAIDSVFVAGENVIKAVGEGAKLLGIFGSFLDAISVALHRNMIVYFLNPIMFFALTFIGDLHDSSLAATGSRLGIGSMMGPFVAIVAGVGGIGLDSINKSVFASNALMWCGMGFTIYRLFKGASITQPQRQDLVKAGQNLTDEQIEQIRNLVLSQQLGLASAAGAVNANNPRLSNERIQQLLPPAPHGAENDAENAPANTAARADQVIANLSGVQNNLGFQEAINAMETDRIREVIARLQQRMGNNNPNAAGRFQAGQLLGRIRQAVAQRAIGQGGSKKHKSHRTIRRRKNNKRRTHKRV